MGKCSDHLQEHTPGRRRRVDSFRQAAKAGAGFFDALHDGKHVFQRTGQAVKLPDYEYVAFAELCEQAL
jgi:hypothetical protein